MMCDAYKAIRDIFPAVPCQPPSVTFAFFRLKIINTLCIYIQILKVPMSYLLAFGKYV